jgi:hypothetical protein
MARTTTTTKNKATTTMTGKGHMNPSALLIRRTSQSSKILRVALLGATLGWFFQKIMKPRWLPWGPAIEMVNRPTYADVDPTNDSLTAKRKLLLSHQVFQKCHLMAMLSNMTLHFCTDCILLIFGILGRRKAVKDI